MTHRNRGGGGGIHGRRPMFSRRDAVGTFRRLSERSARVSGEDVGLELEVVLGRAAGEIREAHALVLGGLELLGDLAGTADGKHGPERVGEIATVDPEGDDVAAGDGATCRAVAHTENDAAAEVSVVDGHDDWQRTHGEADPPEALARKQVLTLRL